MKTTKTMKPPMCGGCRAGEILDVEAVVAVRGRDERGHPINRKHLCEDHYNVELENGAQYRIIEDFRVTRERRLDNMTRRHTGYADFAHLCGGNPTLRADMDPSGEVALLRAEFKLRTGKEAP